MMKSPFVLSVLLTSTLANQAMAGECNSLDDCLSKVKSKKVKYLHGLKKESKDFYFSFNGDYIEPNLVSFMLRSNGFSRVPLQENLYEIINSRDLRYRSLPVVDANAKQAPKLNNSADFKMMIYKLKSDAVHAATISRNLRPFMSRYGRIIDITYPATIMVSDSEDNLAKLYTLIKQLDKPLTKSQIKELEGRRMRRQKDSKMSKSS